MKGKGRYLKNNIANGMKEQTIFAMKSFDKSNKT